MKNGIPNYNEIIFTKQQKEEIVKLYIQDRLSTPKIGQLMGCNYGKICRVLDEYDIKRMHNGVRKYYLNEAYFDQIDTPNKAYVLGLFFADGSNFPPKGTACISLQESDKKLLEDIKKEIKSNNPLRLIDQSKRKSEYNYSYNNMYALNMNSVHICKSLEKLGAVRNKSLVLEFPDIHPDLYSHFIRGYYDGDGSVYRYVKNENNRRITLTITSTENFCKKIKEITETMLGIYCGIYDASCHNGITKVASFSGTSAVKLMDWMYKDAEMYLQRKYDRYIEYTVA